MKDFFGELVLWFFLAVGFFFIFTAMKAFLKVTLPRLPLPSGLQEAFA